MDAILKPIDKYKSSVKKSQQSPPSEKDKSPSRYNLPIISQMEKEHIFQNIQYTLLNNAPSDPNHPQCQNNYQNGHRIYNDLNNNRHRTGYISEFVTEERYMIARNKERNIHYKIV